MTNQVSYNLDTEDGVRHITITPVNQVIPGGNLYSTGVYKLTEGDVGMGEIIFDDEKNDWNYNGIGDLTYDEAATLANFILKYEDKEQVNVYK